MVIKWGPKISNTQQLASSLKDSSTLAAPPPEPERNFFLVSLVFLDFFWPNLIYNMFSFFFPTEFALPSDDLESDIMLKICVPF